MPARCWARSPLWITTAARTFPAVPEPGPASRRAFAPLSPRRVAQPLTRAENLPEQQRERLEAPDRDLSRDGSACHPSAFLRHPAPPRKDNPARLAARTTATREADLPHLHSFTRGIAQDTDAVTAAITLDHHNGRPEPVGGQSRPAGPDRVGWRTVPTDARGQRQSTNSSHQQTKTAPVGEQSPPTHADSTGWPTAPTDAPAQCRLADGPVADAPAQHRSADSPHRRIRTRSVGGQSSSADAGWVRTVHGAGTFVTGAVGLTRTVWTDPVVQTVGPIGHEH
jgi:hypothetical protein